MSFVLIIPDCRISLPKLNNQQLLEVSLTLFFIFVVAEVIGALLSNSLSLLGDAASMGVDVSTYVCNIYGEWAKDHNQRSSVKSRIILEVAIPAVSTLALLGVTIYIIVDAIKILHHPPVENDVNTNYLYGYAAVNLLVDLICGVLFSMKAEEVFVEVSRVPKISLDTTITFDQDEDDFGQLEDDLDDFMNSSPTQSATWNVFGGDGGGKGYLALSTTGTNGNSAHGSSTSNNRLIATGNFLNNPVNLCKMYFANNCCCCCGASICGQHQQDEGAGVPKKNLNMMSAFTHILGDTLRTIAMFLAALVSTISGVDGDICDAWAALVVSITILVLCLSLVLDIVTAAREVWVEEFDEGRSGGGRRRSGSGSRSGSSRSSGSRAGDSDVGAYRRVKNDIDCDDIADDDDDCVEL